MEEIKCPICSGPQFAYIAPSPRVYIARSVRSQLDSSGKKIGHFLLGHASLPLPLIHHVPGWFDLRSRIVCQGDIFLMQAVYPLIRPGPVKVYECKEVNPSCVSPTFPRPN